MSAPLPAYRVLPPERGYEWLVQGFRLFQRQPMLWIVMVLVWGFLAVVVMFVPVVSIASPLLMPLMLAGLMVGSAHLAHGRPMEFGHLFTGFHKPIPLLMAGLPLVLTQIVIGLLLAGVLLTFLGGWLFSSDFQLLLAGKRDIVEVLYEIGFASLYTLLMTTLVGTLLYMVVWFGLCLAPALIILGRLEPGVAVKASFRAVFANWLPWTIYGIASLLLVLLSLLTLGLGLLVLYPVTFASFYAAYRDIFPELPEYLES
ncbi:BPSS1780 family membrane protein [Chitinimonas lacunae]|uniref:BPSS1780 family membrane protein n=1 Tax=Chitinimonas lacunae TaxID=1963018 RepID=A0ABV8MSR3_9NEIS